MNKNIYIILGYTMVCPKVEMVYDLPPMASTWRWWQDPTNETHCRRVTGTGQRSPHWKRSGRALCEAEGGEKFIGRTKFCGFHGI